MAVKFNKLPQRLKRRAESRHSGTTRLRKAPEVEHPIAYSKPSGIIRPDTRNLTLPNSLVEASDNRPKRTMPWPDRHHANGNCPGFILLIAGLRLRCPQNSCIEYTLAIFRDEVLPMGNRWRATGRPRSRACSSFRAGDKRCPVNDKEIFNVVCLVELD
ncbi:MAG: hypothetical protein IPJ07_10820 [Acidobacteria bacterium]|nr:hypothetical protein [Acidobacteriota bacterium]